MRISQKARYAVKASLDLALHAPADRGLRSAEVAQRTEMPEKFLEAILRDLRGAGLVASKRGPDGGHRLASDPSRVTVAAIVEAIDGPFSTESVKHRGRERPEAACVRSLWGRVEAVVRDVLETVTLDDLRREASASEPLDFSI
jgi:Rrf2 family protein